MDAIKRILDRRLQRRVERNNLEQRLAQLDKEDADDATALRVLRGLYPEGPDPWSEPPAAARTQEPMATGRMSTKDAILAVLRDAYPNGLTAAQIKGKVFLKFRIALNPNTTTVSLVRFRKAAQPQVRIEGKTWFYVKDEAETKTAGGNVES